MPSCLLRGGIRAHQREDPVGQVAVRGPHLAAVHDEVVAVAHRAGLERGEVGAGVRLRVALAPADLAARDLRQVLALLLLGAVAAAASARSSRGRSPSSGGGSRSAPSPLRAPSPRAAESPPPPYSRGHVGAVQPRSAIAPSQVFISADVVDGAAPAPVAAALDRDDATPRTAGGAFASSQRGTSPRNTSRSGDRGASGASAARRRRGIAGVAGAREHSRGPFPAPGATLGRDGGPARESARLLRRRRSRHRDRRGRARAFRSAGVRATRDRAQPVRRRRSARQGRRVRGGSGRRAARHRCWCSAPTACRPRCGGPPRRAGCA